MFTNRKPVSINPTSPSFSHWDFIHNLALQIWIFIWVTSHYENHTICTRWCLAPFSYMFSWFKYTMKHSCSFSVLKNSSVNTWRALWFLFMYSQILWGFILAFRLTLGGATFNIKQLLKFLLQIPQITTNGNVKSYNSVLYFQEIPYCCI